MVVVGSSSMNANVSVTTFGLGRFLVHRTTPYTVLQDFLEKNVVIISFLSGWCLYSSR